MLCNTTCCLLLSLSIVIVCNVLFVKRVGLSTGVCEMRWKYPRKYDLIAKLVNYFSDSLFMIKNVNVQKMQYFRIYAYIVAERSIVLTNGGVLSHKRSLKMWWYTIVTRSVANVIRRSVIPPKKSQQNKGNYAVCQLDDCVLRIACN